MVHLRPRWCDVAGTVATPRHAEIERYLQSNGIRAESVIWYEDRETGTTLKRPAFEQLQAHIFTGKSLFGSWIG